jgi:ABC-type Fe3+/spermidine/putrescine transport system ATPase subunit
MNQGRIAQSGAPSEVYDHPATPYVANFLGRSNMIGSRVLAATSDGLKVRVGKSEILCKKNGQRFSEGDKVTVSIRPEKAILIVAGAAAPEGHGIIDGVVRDCLFHGNGYRVEMDIGESEPFFIDVPLHTDAARAAMPEPGSAVAVAVDPANVTTFLPSAE